MEYIVTAKRYRAPILNKDGKVIGVGPRSRQGDRVEVPENMAAPLVAQGGLRVAEDPSEVEETQDEQGTATPDGEGENSQEQETSDDATVEDENEGEGESTEDGLDDMAYPDLQSLAKEETGNGSGSKADLIERIRAHRTN